MAKTAANAIQNNVQIKDRPVHNWYRFVLSYPPHLVRDYLVDFGLEPGQTVLDPFCGTGTTLVECKKQGISSVGIEANAVAQFASRVKTDWRPDPIVLRTQAAAVAQSTAAILLEADISDDFYLLPDGRQLLTLPSEAADLLLKDTISPLPLHKTLVLNSQLDAYRLSPTFDHLRLALAYSTVQNASNLYFGPEVGVRPPKVDATVITPWQTQIQQMAADLTEVSDRAQVPTIVHLADARHIKSLLKPESIDAVITSPPYPNEKDYSRTTRLESVLLGFLHNRADLQALKRTLLRSNSRTVYVGDSDGLWVADNQEIQALAHRIEARRIELGKTSGFEKLYAKVVTLYFGGMARHLAELRPLLRPGASLAYVVGDQASFFQIPIRTGQLLAQIAESLNYECVRIDLFRTRLSTVTREQLREEVVVLRWPGATRAHND